jgi:hypothetical protein
MRNDQRDPGAGAGVPAPVFSHDDDASVAGSPRPVVPPEWAERLRDIQPITDAALSMLNPRALLDALVDRAKEALGADTSAILLLDRRSGLLVATAASGLEEEVQQGVRIPVGKGFAGRIAAQGRPVILDEVDHTKVINPILLEKGIRSLMGAPLLADGEVIGVLHVGTLRPARSLTTTWICSSSPPTGPRSRSRRSPPSLTARPRLRCSAAWQVPTPRRCATSMPSAG